MREVFKNELKALADDLVIMASKAAQAIEQASEAIQTNDLGLAESVIDSDREIDNLESQIDRQAAQILALQAPVAADLRVVISALKMSIALERMGDLARHIASLVRIRHPKPAVPDEFRDTFNNMGRSAKLISTTLVSLLDNPGLAAVPTINAIDEELDELHLRIFTLISDQQPGDITPAQIADVTLLSRYYERFGDQAVNVSQKVEYLLTGNWEPELSAKD
ncbi:phosphate signaling complex protein PhoU [Brevibacterium daeguense]|uniref:Phosphate-specific transport system accessory protein PhoU n=1 Tax=Brevibacterium daeguense TaxID=909936 RepID=A0ABP8EGQ0_9MICO|nr:phosphate signaling complex protein PhoU [Brevibacterium daeguense]